MNISINKKIKKSAGKYRKAIGLYSFIPHMISEAMTMIEIIISKSAPIDLIMAVKGDKIKA